MNKAYKVQHRPDQLSARESQALAKYTYATASKKDGTFRVLLDAHPRWKEHGAASTQKPLACSVENENLQAWLKSTRGQVWAKTRDK